MSKEKIPDIPSPTGVDRNLERVLNPIIENLRIYRGASGDPLDEVVTVGEFAELLSSSELVQDLIVGAHTHTEFLPLDGSGAMIGTLFLTHTIKPQISCRATDSGNSHALFQNTTTGNSLTDGLFVGITSVENAIFWNYEATNVEIGTHAKRHVQCVSDAETNLYYNGNLKASTTNTGLDINGDLVLDLGATIDEFSTDGTLAGNSDIACPTEQAVKTYVDNHIAFGEIYAHDNAATTSVSSAGWTQILIFNANGESNNTTPDHTNDHITITQAGKYAVDISLAVANNAGASHVVEFSMYINNGVTEFINIHAHRSLGAGTDIGSVSLSGIADLAASDTVELWATTSRAIASNITVSDVDLRVIKIGV